VRGVGKNYLLIAIKNKMHPDNVRIDVNLQQRENARGRRERQFSQAVRRSSSHSSFASRIAAASPPPGILHAKDMRD
jgi:hypothetical protein